MTNQHKWGIIYCPKGGIFGYARKRWEHAERCLKARGIDYDMVQSENSKSVVRLIKMMVQYDLVKEQLRHHWSQR